MSRPSAQPRLVHVATIPSTFMFLTSQIAHMRGRGLDVHTISSSGDLPDGFGDSDMAAHHPIDMTRRITPAQDLRALRGLVRQIRTLGPAIVHSHTPKAGLLGTMAARLAGVPIRIYQIHGLPFMTATSRKRQILRFTERLSCRLASEVLCVSHGMRNVAISEGFCPPDKIKVLREGSINGVDAEVKFNPEGYPDNVRLDVRRRYGIPENAVVVGFVGRVVRDKGVRELAQAWSGLRQDFGDAHLLLVGDFDEDDRVPEFTERALRRDNTVHLPGLVWDMPPCYKAMDLVVLPTYREGFPVVPLEAAAMGLPIVATSVPGCTDAVVDGVTGTLIPPRDPHALKEAVGVYLADPALRAAHGMSARERVLTEFRPCDIWEATYTEYRRLMDRAGLQA